MSQYYIQIIENNKNYDAELYLGTKEVATLKFRQYKKKTVLCSHRFNFFEI